MRVGIFAYTDDAPTLETGVTTYNRELARELCARYPQHHFSIYLAEKNSRKFVDLNAPNLSKIVIPHSRSQGAGGAGTRRTANSKVLSLLKFFARELAFRAGVRAFPHRYALYESIEGLSQQDLLIYTVFGHFPDFPLYVKRQTRAACVSAIHDIRVMYSRGGNLREAFETRRGRYMLSRIVRESDVSLVPSTYIRRVLSDAFCRDSRRLAVSFIVPDLYESASSTHRLSPAVKRLLDSRAKYVFYPSTVVETKNHLNLVRAIWILRQDLPAVKLILAGSNKDSSLGRRVFSLISECGVADNVCHLGFIDEDDKRALYEGAVALVVPSIGESFSLPIWEAFANGCPVVASADRDIPEQVADAALICDPHDPQDIAAKIRLVWSDEGLRARLVEAGLRRYRHIRQISLFTGWESAIL